MGRKRFAIVLLSFWGGGYGKDDSIMLSITNEKFEMTNGKSLFLPTAQ